MQKDFPVSLLGEFLKKGQKYQLVRRLNQPRSPPVSRHSPHTAATRKSPGVLGFRGILDRYSWSGDRLLGAICVNSGNRLLRRFSATNPCLRGDRGGNDTLGGQRVKPRALRCSSRDCKLYRRLKSILSLATPGASIQGIAVRHEGCDDRPPAQSENAGSPGSGSAPGPRADAGG